MRFEKYPPALSTRSRKYFCISFVRFVDFVYVTDAKATLPIHREAPTFAEQATEMEMLTTGIKVKMNFVLELHRRTCFMQLTWYVLTNGHLLIVIGEFL